ncbi:MAG: monoterpene epsilon-lactone hydrolase [Parasphingorhabdus sp.]|jgi:monoterpene epsilon-lactone hydrolase
MKENPHRLSADISEQARNFLETSPVFRSDRIDHSNIAEIREQTRAGYQQGCDDVVEQYQPKIEDINLNGNSIQLVTPKSYKNRDEKTAIFYLFGGGFFTGSPREDLRIIVPLADLLGLPVYAPWYPLSPEARFPTAKDMVLDSYQSLADSSEIEKIALVGESAGGNLAIQTLLHNLDRQILKPSVVGLLSPWCDLQMSGHSHDLLEGIDPTLNRVFLEDAVNCYRGEQEAGEMGISPLRAKFDSRFPPTYISSGTNDYLLSDTLRLTTRLRDAGIEVEQSIRESMWHVFEFYPEMPEARQSLQALARFLRKYL